MPKRCDRRLQNLETAMKVKIKQYKDFFGPYQLAELLMFWVPKETDEYGFEHTASRVHKFGEWLATGKIKPEPQVGEVYSLFDSEESVTWLYKFLLWIDKFRQRGRVSVKIDTWDTWSMDRTLAYIVYPMLVQLKATKHSAPYVELADVPASLHPAKMLQHTNEDSSVDSTHFARWDWVLDEMIFAFKSLAEDTEPDFSNEDNETPVLMLEKLEDGSSRVVSSSKESQASYNEYTAHHARVQNGFRLFGKYYSSLWD